MASYSKTAKFLTTLLNNACELVVQSNDRKGAKEVVNAMVIHANNNRFPIPDEKVENFKRVLLDSRPYTLAAILRDIAEDIIRIEKDAAIKRDHSQFLKQKADQRSSDSV